MPVPRHDVDIRTIVNDKTYKDSVSLNGIIAETFTFSGYSLKGIFINTNTKTKTVADDKILKYFAMFIEDYQPDTAPKKQGTLIGADGDPHDYTEDKFTPAQDITSKYNDITTNIRVVDDNLKVCPNNSEDGTWENSQSDNTKPKILSWYSDEPIYVIICQNEGYLDYTKWDAPSLSQPLKRNWNKNLGVVDYKHGYVIDGLLTFPYGPVIITMPDNAQRDAFGPFYIEEYEADDGTGAGLNKERYYTKFGKILGSMTDKTIGIVSAVGSGYISNDSLHFDEIVEYDIAPIEQQESNTQEEQFPSHIELQG